MISYDLPEIKIDFDLHMALIRYPAVGHFISSMQIMEVFNEVEKLANEKNASMEHSKWVPRIVMDGPNKYHIEIMHSKKTS